MREKWLWGHGEIQCCRTAGKEGQEDDETCHGWRGGKVDAGEAVEGAGGVGGDDEEDERPDAGTEEADEEGDAGEKGPLVLVLVAVVGDGDKVEGVPAHGGAVEAGRRVEEGQDAGGGGDDERRDEHVILRSMLVDLATTVPAPLTAALVPHAPLLAVLRRALQIVAWKSSWYDAFLAVALWWALCLLADPVLRYLLPLLIVVAVVAIPWHQRPAPATETTLQNALADLAAINALRPHAPSTPPPSTLIRIAAVVYVPYLLLTYLVPLRILLALLGTAVLAARAPFTALIISTLSRSAYLRHAFRYLVSILTGNPLPQTVLSYHPSPSSPVPVPALRFLFTVYENQRWWVGLDWTAALLPGERPSWCSPPPTHAPVSPPNAFALPSATTVFLPDGKGHRVKRTAIWRWEEPDWRVVVRREGGPPSRVERPIPEDTSDLPANESTGTKLLKAAGKMRESAMSTTTPPAADDVHEDYPEEDHVATDVDGWVYGDNKWEGPSGKGGMGKYTRYRRWTRVAMVIETVEVVDDGPVGVERPEPTATPETCVPLPGEEVHAVGRMTGSPVDDSPLRQRLRRALSKTSE
ncbi:hypothetical protein C0992_006162 [Termitomyces sp. T32_za158]|nr:hypothetical protein C0992_006162 [Termitomyces sp. T32_za158]